MNLHIPTTSTNIVLILQNAQAFDLADLFWALSKGGEGKKLAINCETS